MASEFETKGKPFHRPEPEISSLQKTVQWFRRIILPRSQPKPFRLPHIRVVLRARIEMSAKMWRLVLGSRVIQVAPCGRIAETDLLLRIASWHDILSKFVEITRIEVIYAQHRID
jgi:hypothetical protein